MAHRAQYLNSSDIGVFCCLTNAYCVVGAGRKSNFFSTFDEELGEDIPVFTATINGTKVVGSMIVGNSKGLLVPSVTNDKELLHIRNNIPSEIVVQRIDERLSALGNCVCCNDKIALIHKDISRNTKEIIEDVLGVEAIRTTIAGNPLVGTYCVFTNKGGLVHPKTPKKELDKISRMIKVPVVAGTVNRGSALIGSGVVGNDFTAFCGMKTTATEISVVESIFSLKDSNPTKFVTDLRESLFDSL